MSGTVTIRKEPAQAPVTILEFSANGLLLFVGIGSSVHVYEVETGKRCLSKTLIDGRAIHGLIFAAQNSGEVVCAFGQKKMCICTNVPTSPASFDGKSGTFFDLCCDFKEFNDLIWDMRFVEPATDDNASDFSHSGLAVIGFAHNYVQLWKWTSTGEHGADNTLLLQHVQCKDICLLYCLSFQQEPILESNLHDIVVGSGTVMNQILLWHPFTEECAKLRAENKEDQSVCMSTTAEVMQRLIGHGGVLFRICWTPDSGMIASVSDDRTVRLWGRQLPSDNGTTHQYKEIGVGWGHKARLWDVRFIKLPSPHQTQQTHQNAKDQKSESTCWGLVTASEDTTAKLWCIPSGVGGGGSEEGSEDVQSLECRCTFRGHAGRHVWRVAAHPSLPLVSTGGNDSSAKLWHWPTHYEHEKAAQKQSRSKGKNTEPDLPMNAIGEHLGNMRVSDFCVDLPSSPPAQKKEMVESVRCLAFGHCTGVSGVPQILLATSKGKLWGVEQQDSNEGDRSDAAWRLLYDPAAAEEAEAPETSKTEPATAEDIEGESMATLVSGPALTHEVKNVDNPDLDVASKESDALTTSDAPLSKRQRKKQKCRSERHTTSKSSNYTVCCLVQLPPKWVKKGLQGVALGSASGDITAVYVVDDSNGNLESAEEASPRKTPRRDQTHQSARDLPRTATSVAPLGQTAWKAHRTRVVNMFPVMQAGNHNEMLLFSASADGELKCWQLPSVDPSAKTDQSVPTLLGQFKIPSKSCVTAMCVKWCADGSERTQTGLLYCGDGRGNLFTFAVDLSSLNPQPAQPLLDMSLRKLHGRDIVTTMKWHGDYLFTAGHDGYVNRLRHHNQTPSEHQGEGTSSPEERVLLRHGPLVRVASTSTAPIASIEQLHWTSARHPPLGREVLIAVGYYGDELIVKDITDSQELLRTSAGGWKRPHAVWLPIGDPDHSDEDGVGCTFTLASAPPTNKRTPVAKLSVKTSPTAKLSPSVVARTTHARARSLGTAFHGRVGTSAYWCKVQGLHNASASMAQSFCNVPEQQQLAVSSTSNPQSLLFTAGQDNVVKVYAFYDDKAASDPVCVCSREGHPTVIRDLTASYVPPPAAISGSHLSVPPLVVSGGGKEIVMCWQVVGEANSASPEALLKPTLELVCSHCRVDALMDHRHTAVTAFPLTAGQWSEDSKSNFDTLIGEVHSKKSGNTAVSSAEIATDGAVANTAYLAHAADPVHLLSLGTSEGRLLLLAVKQRERRCSEVAEFWYNSTRELSKPVMCIGHHIHTHALTSTVYVQTQLVVAGSTDGSIGVFDVGPTVRAWLLQGKSTRKFRHHHLHHHDQHHQHLSDGEEVKSADPAPSVAAPVLWRYRAHAMGTNCLSVKSCTPSEPGTVEVVIVSGGDDESITVARFTLLAHGISGANAALPFTLTCVSLQRLEGASGSALKAIEIMDPPKHQLQSTDTRCQLGVVMSSGYEQRLSMWVLYADDDSIPAKAEETSENSAQEEIWVPCILNRGWGTNKAGSTTAKPDCRQQLKLIGETFVEVADIGDVGVVQNGEATYSAAVVGEGMHIIHMDC